MAHRCPQIGIDIQMGRYASAYYARIALKRWAATRLRGVVDIQGIAKIQEALVEGVADMYHHWPQGRYPRPTMTVITTEAQQILDEVLDSERWVNIEQFLKDDDDASSSEEDGEYIEDITIEDTSGDEDVDEEITPHQPSGGYDEDDDLN